METAVIVLMIFFIASGLIKFWPKTGKMGINLKKVNCPECGATASMVRKPKNLKQALWGGWTCDICGTEMDKYGIKTHS